MNDDDMKREIKRLRVERDNHQMDEPEYYAAVKQVFVNAGWNPGQTSLTDDELQRLAAFQAKLKPVVDTGGLKNLLSHITGECQDGQPCIFNNLAVSDKELAKIKKYLMEVIPVYTSNRVKEAREAHVGRLHVLRSWLVNHLPVFDSAERLGNRTLSEIDDEIRIVESWMKGKD